MGDSVGLGEGISEGAPVGDRLGELVGSHEPQFKVKFIA